MAFVSRLALAVTMAVAAVGDAEAERVGGKTQFVIISFDGAHDIGQWRRSRALAQRTGARFTYFLSCVFLLSPETRGDYRPPAKAPAKSNVGFALSTTEVAERLEQIQAARGEGHEIASHGCGHFDGAHWSKDDWRSELSSFRSILANAYSTNGIKGEPAYWRRFAQTEIRGFRAPYLATGRALYTALAEDGFDYDASGISQGPVEPQRAGNVMRFALPMIAEGPSGRPVVAMDYNLFVRHSGGKEAPDPDSKFEDRAYDAFLAEFEDQYEGNRVPLQLGFHFTLMNDGAYWRALERFAETVCGRPDVACVSYRDFLATGVDSANDNLGG